MMHLQVNVTQPQIVPHSTLPPETENQIAQANIPNAAEERTVSCCDHWISSPGSDGEIREREERICNITAAVAIILVCGVAAVFAWLFYSILGTDNPIDNTVTNNTAS